MTRDLPNISKMRMTYTQERFCGCWKRGMTDDNREQGTDHRSNADPRRR